MTDRSHDQAVYVISVAAELAGMHPQTLRIYERRGLVAPARTEGGNRRYSDEDIEVLRRIAELTGEGMNLEGIRRVMRLEAENHRLRTELEMARELMLHTIADAERHQSSSELVPLRQSMALFTRRVPATDDDSNALGAVPNRGSGLTGVEGLIGPVGAAGPVL